MIVTKLMKCEFSDATVTELLTSSISDSAISEICDTVLEAHEASEFNSRVGEIVFHWLLENDLVEDSDIPDGNTPEDAAQTFINVYRRLMTVEEIKVPEISISDRIYELRMASMSEQDAEAWAEK